ncbi:MAG: FecR domain-containing protein [Bacteroidales bacterium]|nr:FecR domain-containing protein [Bacteroidales bacterium]
MDAENKHIDPVGLLPKYFAGEASAEERKEVDDWLSADKNNQAEFKAFAKLWNITGTIAPGEDIDLDKEWQKLESVVMPARVRTITLVRIIRIAASVVLISALAFFGFKVSKVKTEKAPVAELSTVTLPDGTLVSINAGSKITYQKGFGMTNRNISLKGEAYFDVVRNTALPFIVTTGEASIKVTGTKFNVRAYKDQTEIKVTVTEGTVILYETRQPLKEAVVSAGETGTFDRTVKVVRKQQVIDLNDIAWKTMILDFNDATLSEVAGVLENTYHSSIIVDQEVQSCSITVRFEDQELASVLKVLKSTLDLTITSDGKHIIISGNGC